MQDRIIRFGSLISIIVMIVICTYIFIVHNSMNRTMVVTSIFWSVGIGIAVSIVYKIVLSYEERHLSELNVNLEENEIVILQGPSYLRQDKGSKNGILMLTSDRLIFWEMSGHKHVFLKEISNIAISKTLGFLKTGLIISVDNSTQIYEIDYPSDWKKIVERQKSFN